MKSLEERHVSRAQRKVDNAAEGGANASPNANAVNEAAVKIGAARDAVSALSAEQRETLKDFLADTETLEGGSVYETEAHDREGVGVVNTAVVPADRAAEIEANATAAIEGATPSFDPAQGNLNGQAVAAAGDPNAEARAAAGWGASSQTEKAAVSVGMKVAELEAIAEDEKVDLTGASNNEERVKRIEAARASAE